MIVRYLSTVLAVLGAAGSARAQDMPLRAGQPSMASDGSPDRDGRPATLAAPAAAIDPARAAATRFAAAYARAGRPRLVVFWNRELTDDVASEQDTVSTLTVDGRSSGSSWQRDRATRRGSRTDAGADDRTSTEATLRTGTRRIDPGRHAPVADEADDFDLERGFSDALEQAGARLVDRTSIVRQGALAGDARDPQAIETRAILGRAELTLEVVGMAASPGGGGRWRIVARDVKSGRKVAMAASTGTRPAAALPYVAGEHGFVRATPRAATAYETGRRIGADAMGALAAGL